jgi:PhnB protein
VTPYLIIKGASDAIAYYQRAFGAVELFRMGPPGGPVAHAEIKIGDSILMMADEHADRNVVGPATLGDTSVHFMIYVEDVDTVFPRAIAEGGTELRPIRNQFHGDRSGTLRDPFGHEWTISTHVEDVPPEELEERAKAHSEAGA